MASAQPVDPRSRAQDLLGQIDQALAARDGTRADKLLEQAMTRAPQPEVSLRLGRLAELEGRAVEALDHHRRYLDLMGDAADGRCRCDCCCGWGWPSRSSRRWRWGSSC